MTLKGQMLNCVVLSLCVLAMGALCTPIFQYRHRNTTRNQVAEVRNPARTRLRPNPTVSTFRRKIPPSKPIDGYSGNENDGWNYRVIDSLISQRRWSQFEPNFLQGAVDILGLHALLNVSAAHHPLRKYSAQPSSLPQIANNSDLRRQYREFFDDFVFSGSNVGAFFQHVQTMSAARYRPIPDEDSLRYSTKNATPAIDVLKVLKKRKKRRWSGSDRKSGPTFSRRRKRETDSYYQESPEEIVRRVLKQRKEQEEGEGEELDRLKRKKTPLGKAAAAMTYAAVPIAAIPVVVREGLIPLMNASRNFLANEPQAQAAATNESVKVFIYNLTTLHERYRDYYSCMAMKKNLYLDKVGKPMEIIQQILVSASEKLTLSCHACLPPLVVAKRYGVRWMRRMLSKGGFEEVPKTEDDEENFAMDDNGALVIQGMALEDAGMYTCFNNGAHESTYFVGVENNVDRRRVYESGEESRPKPAKPEILMVNNLYLFTEWSDWSPCNMCNQRGQRKRVGLCMIKKYDSKVAVRPKEARLLNKYPNGVPCRSAILPPYIGELDRVKNRSSEFMIGYCYMECTTIQPVLIITDMNGIAVELVEEAKGRKSLRGTPPPIAKEIVRQTFYVDMYRRITLECPTDDENAILAIRWQNGSQILDEISINEETKGRVYIDYNNKLIIKSAWVYDRAVYSCWINLVRIAILRLEVATPIDASILSIFSGGCFVFFLIMVVYLGVHLSRFASEKPVSKVFRGR